MILVSAVMLERKERLLFAVQLTILTEISLLHTLEAKFLCVL